MSDCKHKDYDPALLRMVGNLLAGAGWEKLATIQRVELEHAAVAVALQVRARLKRQQALETA